MNSERKIPPICKVCQVLDDGATNHEYCKTFLQQESIREEKERKKEAKRKKKAMEAILDEHYKDDEPESKKSKSYLAKSSSYWHKYKKFKCGKCEYFTYDLKDYQKHEAQSHVIKSKNEYFTFPNFQGFNCELRRGIGADQKENYFVTEVYQPQNYEHDNLSETCYFFIPASIIKLHLNLINTENVKIPFFRNGNDFIAKFPNLDVELEVCWPNTLMKVH